MLAHMTTEKALHTEHVVEEGRPSTHGKTRCRSGPAESLPGQTEAESVFSRSEQSKRAQRRGRHRRPFLHRHIDKEVITKECPASLSAGQDFARDVHWYQPDSRHDALIPAGTAFHDAPAPQKQTPPENIRLQETDERLSVATSASLYRAFVEALFLVRPACRKTCDTRHATTRFGAVSPWSTVICKANAWTPRSLRPAPPCSPR